MDEDIILWNFFGNNKFFEKFKFWFWYVIFLDVMVYWLGFKNIFYLFLDDMVIRGDFVI